jgi:hypothetical protein
LNYGKKIRTKFTCIVLGAFFVVSLTKMLFFVFFNFENHLFVSETTRNALKAIQVLSKNLLLTIFLKANISIKVVLE